MDYGATGHGGNKKLREQQPSDFLLIILQRRSPDMERDQIGQLESSWKDRLEGSPAHAGLRSERQLTRLLRDDADEAIFPLNLSARRSDCHRVERTRRSAVRPSARLHPCCIDLHTKLGQMDSSIESPDHLGRSAITLATASPASLRPVFQSGAWSDATAPNRGADRRS